MAGIEAKAVCVRLRTLIEDYDQHQQVAVSLADDLVQLGPQSITQPLLAAADAEIVAAGERFEPLLGKYLPARFEWARLSRAARAEATATFGDDYSSDGWSKPSTGSSPGTAFLMGAHKRNGSVRASRHDGAARRNEIVRRNDPKCRRSKHRWSAGKNIGRDLGLSAALRGP
jgi:hypothetical protein